MTLNQNWGYVPYYNKKTVGSSSAPGVHGLFEQYNALRDSDGSLPKPAGSGGPAWNGNSSYSLALATPNTITNPNSETSSSDDFYGQNPAGFAITNTHMFIGASREDHGISASGSVYQYSFNGTLVRRLDGPSSNSGQTYGSYFGQYVCVDDTHTWLIVGGHTHKVNENAAGAIFVYEIATGSLVRRIDCTGFGITTLANRQMCQGGNSTGLSTGGSQIAAVMNVYGNGNPSYNYVDSSAIFVWNSITGGGTAANPVTTTTADVTIRHPDFGNSPSNQSRIGSISNIVDGHFLMGDAHHPGGTGGDQRGKAWRINSTTGAVAQTISNPGNTNGDNFGYNCYISPNGNIFAITAPQNITSAGSATNVGKIYVYHINNNLFVNDFTITDPETSTDPTNSWPSRFGYDDAVGLTNTQIIVGSPWWSNGSDRGNGRLHKYDFTITGNYASGVTNHTSQSKPSSAQYDGYGKGVAVGQGRLITGSDLEAVFFRQ